MADEIHDVSIKVVSQKGYCAMGHKVGDEWIVKEYSTPEGICMGAFGAIFSVIGVMAFDGKYPWSKDPDCEAVACADAQNPVVFEVRRLKKGPEVIVA
jgi:uncharacterized repeat protein (TIGR04076 family)